VQDHVCDLDYHSCLVCCTIYIVDWDRICKGASGDMVRLHPFNIDEAAGCTTVDEACVHHLTAMSVDSISTSMASDINPGLDAITYVWGNRRSQARRQLHRLGMGGWEMVCMTFALSISRIAGSIVVSTCRHAYQLCIDSRVILFTRWTGQNPLH
jgi:hypothetical protein